MMRCFAPLFATFLALFLFVSCKKTERNITHQNYEVEGTNKIPPYHGITTLQVKNYVNKMNIDLLGTEAEEQQLDDDVIYLKENELSKQSRETIVTRLQQSTAYFERLFQVASLLMLEGKDRTEIEAARTEQVFARDFLLTTGDTLLAQILSQEIRKLDDLLSAQQDYENKTISIREFYARFAYNLIYDEINMGSQNFVIACFENLLRRYPTQEELADGVKMADGQESAILLKSGNSKLDFLNIMVNSADFHAGRITDAYETMLLRKPASDEMSTLLVPFTENKNYELVLKTILVTDEYAGF